MPVMWLIRLSLVCCLASFGVTTANAKTPLFEDFQANKKLDWRRVGDGRVEKTSFEGNKTLKLTKQAAVLKRVSTIGYKEVSVSGQFSAWSLEGDEQCVLEVTVDKGRSWVSVLNVGSKQADGYTLHGGYSNDIDFDNAKELILRARVLGDSNDDSCWLDNVLVEGIAIYNSDTDVIGENYFSANFLSNKKALDNPVTTQYFAPSSKSVASTGDVQGRLLIDFSKGERQLDLVRDLWQSNTKERQIDQLPSLELELVQYEDTVLPRVRGLRGDRHPYWEFIVEPGVVWRETSDDKNRLALPFALQQRNANCTHNGVITLMFGESGKATKAIYQVGSETCYYFKFNLWGSAEATFIDEPITDAKSIINQRKQELAERIVTKPINELASVVSNVDLNNIGSATEVMPRDLSVHGFVVDGVHYQGECNTRFGAYPYCSEMVLPSYSTAKSIFGGLGLLALEQRYPGVKNSLIADLVPACKNNSTWQDITIEHTLNMVTGHYTSDLYEVDEGGPEMVKFFNKSSHSDRINLACGMYEKQQLAGNKWVYHTSDTYLAATAMNNFIDQQGAGETNIYDDFLVDPVWKVLGLSPVTYKTRRSYDDRQQGFAGWGLSFLPSDIAQLANALIPTEKNVSKLNTLDKTELRKALQLDPSDRGVAVIGDKTRYKHAFWGYNVQSALNCKAPLWLPFMSGYGGISVVMMPNNMAYYYFSDNQQFAWVKAVQEAHKLRPMCEAA
jgi:hypothetical protein